MREVRHNGNVQTGKPRKNGKGRTMHIKATDHGRDASSLTEMAIAIIKATNDGNDLSPGHLALVQDVVNGRAGEKAIAVFEAIHESVCAGKYQAPWFHAIKNLIRDHEGCVYWKHVAVEHYDARHAYTDKSRNDARVLAQRCRFLESEGQLVSLRAAILLWEEQYLPSFFASHDIGWTTDGSGGSIILVRKKPEAVFGRVRKGGNAEGYTSFDLTNSPTKVKLSHRTDTAFRAQVEVKSEADAVRKIERFAEEWIATHNRSI